MLWKRLTFEKLAFIYTGPVPQKRDWGGGAEINFGGAREVYLCEFERGTGARKVYSSVDQTNKVKTKKKGLRPKSFMKSGVSP